MDFIETVTYASLDPAIVHLSKFCPTYPHWAKRGNRRGFDPIRSIIPPSPGEMIDLYTLPSETFSIRLSPPLFEVLSKPPHLGLKFIPLVCLHGGRWDKTLIGLKMIWASHTGLIFYEYYMGSSLNYMYAANKDLHK